MIEISRGYILKERIKGRSPGSQARTFVGQGHQTLNRIVPAVKKLGILSNQGVHLGAELFVWKRGAGISLELLDRRHRKGRKEVAVKIAPALFAQIRLLHSKRGKVGVVRVSRVFVGGVGPHKPLLFFGQFESVLKKEDILEAVSVVSLINRGSVSEIKGVGQLEIGLKTVVKRAAELEVTGVVIDQIALEQARSKIGSQTRISLYVATVVEGKFISVAIYGIVSARVLNAFEALRSRVEIVGHPIVCAQIKQIHLVGKALSTL